MIKTPLQHLLLQLLNIHTASEVERMVCEATSPTRDSRPLQGGTLSRGLAVALAARVVPVPTWTRSDILQAMDQIGRRNATESGGLPDGTFSELLNELQGTGPAYGKAPEHP